MATSISRRLRSNFGRHFLSLGRIAAWCLCGFLAAAEPPAAEFDEATLRGAVEKGLVRQIQAGTNWRKNKSCFGCHHQTLPMFAVLEAGKAGLTVDAEWMKAQGEFAREYFRKRTAPMEAGRHIGGGSATAASGLWALQLDDRPPDAVTAAMVAYLLKTQGVARSDSGDAPVDAQPPADAQQPRGAEWPVSCVRPPLMESSVGNTVVVLRGLRKYAGPDQRAAYAAAADAAAKWLDEAPLRSTEDRIWMLWNLHDAQADTDEDRQIGAAAKIREDGDSAKIREGGDSAKIREIRAELLRSQRPDGGWGQTADRASDAYATGQTLFVLLMTGTRRDDPATRRGAAYLLRTQHADGSWRVETRARPVQPDFDNGDPHGKHQFLSVAAGSWAVAALSALLPPPSTH